MIASVSQIRLLVRMLCAAVLLTLPFIHCTPSEKHGTGEFEALPTLTVGIQTSPAMTLVMVAEDMGFFDSAGVDVEIKQFTAGKFALQAFLGGSLDIAVSGEVPVTLATLQGNDFRVITQVVERTINECRVVARSDSVHSTPRDYFLSSKRRLATSFGGGPEFFTYCFLKKHGIEHDQIELISQRPEDMPGALVSGSVDAISIFDPFARMAEVMLGNSGMSFADSDIYSELYVADVSMELINERPDAIVSFLHGLYRASAYVARYPNESKAILMRYTGLERDIVDGIWASFVFKPALTDLFVEYTTAQSVWFVENGTFPPDTEMPDFTSLCVPEFLLSIDSTLVTIERRE